MAPPSICIEWGRGVCGSFSLLVRLSSPPSAPLPRSIPSFFPRAITHLPQENEIFFAPCNSLAYGEMSTTQRAVLRNILREDLVCI